LVDVTQDDLRRLINRLDTDPKVAWERYLTLWQKLNRFFEYSNCPAPNDHADEVLSRIARKDDSVELRDITSFAYGVARTVRLEIWESSKKNVPLEAVQTDPKRDDDGEDGLIVQSIDDEARLRCLVGCLKKLPARQRTIFLRFKLAQEDRIADHFDLAERLGVSPGTLRVKMHRIFKEVRECARICMEQRGLDQL